MHSFTEDLLAWYVEHARELPWRGDPDPYAVWVSEIMLQQTRVQTVRPYFARWMARFPTIHALAAADQLDVLNQWEGLGYYSRARNLHKAAQIVVDELGGQIPETAVDLRKLPGIGPYTAGAIASLAFGKDEPVVDGNVRRVLARVFDLDEFADAPNGTRQLWAWAQAYLPAGRAGDYNQALMELGATVCLPRTPKCAQCPVQRHCESFRLNLQAERPRLKPKPNQPHYTVAAAVLVDAQGYVLLAQRPEDGLLGGLWEFPGGKQEKDETLPECLAREIREELQADILVGEHFGVYQHAYTHFRVTLHAFFCTLPDGETLTPVEHQALVWAPISTLDAYPMGKIDRQISQRLQAKTTNLS
jgi:A/G-specific adenine glycosylase